MESYQKIVLKEGHDKPLLDPKFIEAESNLKRKCRMRLNYKQLCDTFEYTPKTLKKEIDDDGEEISLKGGNRLLGEGYDIELEFKLTKFKNQLKRVLNQVKRLGTSIEKAKRFSDDKDKEIKINTSGDDWKVLPKFCALYTIKDRPKKSDETEAPICPIVEGQPEN